VFVWAAKKEVEWEDLENKTGYASAKKKRISILYQDTYPLNDYLYFKASVMGLVVFLEQRLLKRANILHLKTAVAFHHQP
jgi:hypothetical protein